VNDADGTAFPEKELMLMGIDRSGFTTIYVDRCLFIYFERI
jgi:hypothetical protein